jgi:hypothetical protein
LEPLLVEQVPLVVQVQYLLLVEHHLLMLLV